MSAHPTDNGHLHEEVFPFHSEITDEIWNELISLEGIQVVALTLWDETFGQAEGFIQVDNATVDFDVYLANRLMLELYGASLYPDPESFPLKTYDRIAHVLQTMVETGSILEEVALDEADELVLIFAGPEIGSLYVVAQGWILEEWEELPREEP